MTLENKSISLFRKAAFEAINFDPRIKKASSVRWTRMFFDLENYLEDSVFKTAEETLTKSKMKKRRCGYGKGYENKQQKSTGKKEQAKLKEDRSNKSRVRLC